MGLAMWALGWVSLWALDRELLNSFSLLSFLFVIFNKIIVSHCLFALLLQFRPSLDA